MIRIECLVDYHLIPLVIKLSSKVIYHCGITKVTHYQSLVNLFDKTKLKGQQLLDRDVIQEGQQFVVDFYEYQRLGGDARLLSYHLTSSMFLTRSNNKFMGNQDIHWKFGFYDHTMKVEIK